MVRVAFVLLAVAAVALIPASPSIAEVHRPCGVRTTDMESIVALVLTSNAR